MQTLRPEIEPLPVEASLLGESPMWHPAEQVLYWCDIPGRRLHRYDPATAAHRAWPMPVEAACCAPVLGGGLLLGMRDGLWRFDPASGERTRLAAPPYDPARERFNDGKADPQGRFWSGTIYEPRDPPLAALYRWSPAGLERIVDGITTGNGIAFSPDGGTMYWSDTKAHTVYAADFDRDEGTLSARRTHAQFAPKVADRPLDEYGGRPDGATVDAEGCYWAAMFEGQRLVRIAPTGELLAQVPLPVRCPTMPCFGGHDLRTLYVTTARENRPADELARQPLAGRVLQMRIEVAGMPAHFAIV